MNELPFWNTKTKAVAFVSSLSPIRVEVENGEEAVAMAVMVYNDASREWKK